MGSDEELAKQRHKMATGLLQMTEQFQPILDAADGMKTQMEERGWSPTAAETVALQFLCGMINQAFK